MHSARHRSRSRCSSSPAPAAAQELKTDEDKALYAIGLSLSDRLGPFALTPAELELVKAGLADGVARPRPQGRAARST